MKRVTEQPQTGRSRVLGKFHGKGFKLTNKPGPKPMSAQERQRRADVRKQKAAKKYKPKKQKQWNFQKRKDEVALSLSSYKY